MIAASLDEVPMACKNIRATGGLIIQKKARERKPVRKFFRVLLNLHRDHAEDFYFAALEQAAQWRERLPI